MIYFDLQIARIIDNVVIYESPDKHSMAEIPSTNDILCINNFYYVIKTKVINFDTKKITIFVRPS